MNVNTTHNDSGRGGPKPWRWIGWGAAAGLLLTPLVAMQLSESVLWSPGDFLVFGLMLAIAGGLVECSVAMSRNSAYRIGAATAVLSGFLLTWASLAVGIIGSESNPANLAFAAVLAVALVGALLVRGRPAGMAKVMIATAVTQGLVTLAAVLLHPGDVPLVAGLFVGLWLLAALFFGKSVDTD